MKEEEAGERDEVEGEREAAGTVGEKGAARP